MEDLREKLAALEHESWSGWMVFIFSKGRLLDTGPDTGGFLIAPTSAVRWQRQMNTPYADLTESEKESDRKEADRVIALLLEAGVLP
jgi:hypothetical protein